MARLRGSVDGGPGTLAPGRIRFTDMPLKVLIMRAYDVQNFQVSNPSWMDSQRFDIIAQVPDGAPSKMPGSEKVCESGFPAANDGSMVIDIVSQGDFLPMNRSNRSDMIPCVQDGGKER
jgi:hypothetical protein